MANTHDRPALIEAVLITHVSLSSTAQARISAQLSCLTSQRFFVAQMHFPYLLNPCCHAFPSLMRFL
ncbi:hypothetical protein [Photorhabdus sp. CRCIA-P01]|uniref:hypothetical protein n=1 Tax=Photorhabdus sp. CRCIA-P01 TaxID=2019570 RepID=UPI0013003897|nr:hypothetical protein [Photorhabdus sp. CRCIA-P01]